MSDNIDERAERAETAAVVARRRLLASAGTVGAMALAGCVGGSDERATDATADGAENAAGGGSEGTGDDGSGADVDPRFGYTATGDDLPVEPDHTVTLDLQFTEERSEIPEFFFEPTGLYVEPGDTVEFSLATPHHNVNPYHPAIGYNRRVPEGVAPFSSPVLTAGDSWLYTFDREGVYDYMCAPHEIFGMVGRIVVGSATGPGANPVGEAPGEERTRPPEFTAGLVLGDEALAPDRVVEEGSVPWSAIADENKRMLLAPVEE